MLLNRITTNPFDGKPKPWKPWYGYLFILVAIVCFGLYIYQRINGGPVVPTSAIPSKTYTQLIQKKTTAATPSVRAPSETLPLLNSGLSSAINEGDELAHIAKAALELLKTPPAPKKVSENLAVPFTTQAPNAVWDDAHKTMQEEAVLFMVMQYYAGISGAIDSEAADAALFAIIDAEAEIGLDANLSILKFGTFAESYASMKATAINDPTIDQIKAFISEGIPVFVPVATEKMNNEFYLNDAAPYHYVVIRGYDGENFITNDPGTRHGENYSYAQSVIMDAMGDWNDGDPATGVKRILILENI